MAKKVIKPTEPKEVYKSGSIYGTVSTKDL